MKHTFRALLGLVLVVWVLVGCSSPVGPELEVPVVEVPENDVKSVKVDFEWRLLDSRIEAYAPQYLLDLHKDSSLGYCYGLPEGWTPEKYGELYNNSSEFEKFFENAFEQVFFARDCKEGEIISLEQWTSEAVRILKDGTISKAVDRLYFSLKETELDSGLKFKHPDMQDCFEEIVVGNKDILIYVFFDFNKSN